MWLDPNPRVTNHEITEDTKSSVRAEDPNVRGRSGRAADRQGLDPAFEFSGFFAVRPAIPGTLLRGSWLDTSP